MAGLCLGAFQVKAAHRANILAVQRAQLLRVVRQPQGGLGFVGHHPQVSHRMVSAQQQARLARLEVQLRACRAAKLRSSRQFEAGESGDPTLNLNVRGPLFGGLLKALGIGQGDGWVISFLLWPRSLLEVNYRQKRVSRWA